MKKNLFTAILLLSFLPFVKAQQGGVGINTSSPAATLDVTANTTNNALADAVLVPRMTLAQLVAKDNTAGTYSANQNGALIYVTDDLAGSGSRRAKINGHGFYYFDNSVPEWKPFASSSSTTTPTYRTIAGTSLTTLLASDVGNVVIFSGGVSGDVKLPTPDASMIGKKLTLIEISGISQLLANVNPNYKTVTLGALQQYGSEFITDGTNWYALGGQ